MAQARTRRNVLNMDEWDETLLWYARAIAKMQERPVNDPTSWRYQAAIHDYDPNSDPNSSASDTLPSKAEQKRFWAQCQHFSWFFLPWHRMYLGFFEQIVAATVSQLGGPSDWALPYWNYSDDSNPDAQRLPPAFRAESLPDGSPNPLRVEQRAPGVNEGDVVGDSNDVALQKCLEAPAYVAAPTGGDPGFGGPRTRFNHSRGAAGHLERVPHGSMHIAVGGDDGWMSAFNTAGLDPIFWLHHCNLDRLWDVWLRRDSHHLNPNEQNWLKKVAFEFHGPTGEVISLTSSQVADSTAPPLSYAYDDVSDPLGATPPAPLMESEMVPEMEETPIPEMVGATEQPVTLTGQPTTARLAVNQPTGPASAMAESSARPNRVFLNFENITSTGRPGSYMVYLNIPPEADPANSPELYAGMLPMFGVAESTDPTRGHAGNGLHYTLEITDVVRTLEERGDWDPDHMRVTFVPKRRGRPGAEAAEVKPPVQVGRISLYYS